MYDIIAILTSGAGRSCVAAACLSIGLLSLGRLRGTWRGTTLLAPWGWAVFSLAILAGSEIALGWTDSDSAAQGALRYFAAIASFCPAMALLGAKRPQNFGWQFVVLSLLFILGLPAAQWSLFHAGQAQELDPARSWFMSVLLALTAFNHAATRFWPSALFIFAGQVILLNGFLPTPAFADAASAAPLIALALAAAALALVAVGWPRAQLKSDPLDAVWRDFRDLYGNVWAFRVLGRVDETAAAAGWGVSLGLPGFFTIQEPGLADPVVRRAVTEHLGSRLLRFVSREWIAARLTGEETSPEIAA